MEAARSVGGRAPVGRAWSWPSLAALVTFLVLSLVVAGCASDRRADSPELRSPDPVLDGPTTDRGVEKFSIPADAGLVIGAVHDPSGAAMPGIRVALDGTAHEALSSQNGGFVFEGVPAGEYVFVAEARGYYAAEAKVEVPVSMVTRIEVTMVPIDGSSSEASSSGPDGLSGFMVPGAGSVWTLLAFPIVAVLVGAGVLAFMTVRRRRDPGRLAEAARARLAERKTADAELLARRAIDQDADCGEAWFVLGAALIHRGAYRQAVTVLERASRGYDPHVAGIAFLLTIANQRLGKPREARRWLPLVARDEDYWEALEHDPQTAFTQLVAGAKPTRRTDPAYA